MVRAITEHEYRKTRLLVARPISEVSGLSFLLFRNPIQMKYVVNLNTLDDTNSISNIKGIIVLA